MTGFPLGGISMMINLTVMAVSFLKHRLFPCATKRPLKTRNMPYVSFGVLVLTIGAVIASGSLIIDQSVTGNASNAQVLEAIVDNRPLLPCVLMQDSCDQPVPQIQISAAF